MGTDYYAERWDILYDNKVDRIEDRNKSEF